MTAVEAPCRGCGGAAGGRVLRARNARDLAALTRSRQRYDAVELVTERMTPSERAQWEARLAGKHNECGCHAGGLALLAALVVVAVMGIASPDGLSWSRALAALGLCVAAALIGKLAGIVVAQVRLRRDIRRLAGLIA